MGLLSENMKEQEMQKRIKLRKSCFPEKTFLVEVTLNCRITQSKVTRKYVFTVELSARAEPWKIPFKTIQNVGYVNVSRIYLDAKEKP